jgi:hypothetical protein
MRRIMRLVRIDKLGTLSRRNACVLGVALFVILSCSACSDDDTSFHATPDDVVGDWHVAAGEVARDTCEQGGAINFAFDWRLTADGDSISATDEQSCEPNLLGALVENTIVTRDFEETIPFVDCSVHLHRTEDIEFTSRDRAMLTLTEETTASGSGCADLGHPEHCVYVYESLAERCDGCFECVGALAAPPADTKEGKGSAWRFGRPTAPTE